MTTNTTVTITNSAWVNIHSAASVATGTQGIVQNYRGGNVVLVNSTSEPSDILVGGFVLDGGSNNSVSIVPDAGESTFAKLLNDIPTKLRVQF